MILLSIWFMTSNFLGFKTCGSKICLEIVEFLPKTVPDPTQGLLNEINDNPELLKWIIANGEIWMYGYEYDNGCFLKSQDQKNSLSSIKGSAHGFLQFQWFMYHELLPPRHTVNNVYYLEVLCCLCQTI